MEDKIRVLYVDDEENNLQSFRAYFRKDYEIYTAINAAEAMKLLDNLEMHIIISDQRMPQMTGIEFLERTIKLYPESIRLLITGQTDINTVIDAINRGQITKYLQKPWNWETFRIILDNCCDLFKNHHQLKLKNDELQKLNDDLNRFVYSASHDLRSPLMSILGITQLARMDQLTKETEEYFQLIEMSVYKLDTYIKNIIDYYQNSRTDEFINSIDFSLLIKDVIDSLKNNDPSVQLESDIEQHTEFHGDQFRFRVILSNLVANAIKYQNPEAVEHKVLIKIKVANSAVQINISDNGIGIITEHLENIFKMFFRTNQTNKSGNGIGLFIVKEALEKIGGTINVTSTPMVGTSFEIVVPDKIK